MNAAEFEALVDVLMASVELDGFHSDEEDEPAACRTALLSAVKALVEERDQWRHIGHLAEKAVEYARSQRDAALSRAAAAESALAKVNEIRNSIIGLQKTNWSEHIYPLVAVLNAAGLQGMPYPEAFKNFGTMLERTNAAESTSSALRARVEALAAAEEGR